MKLNEYQEKAMTTCMPSSENFSYMMLNLVGEVGEFASKVAKEIRKQHTEISCDDLFFDEWHTEDDEKKYSYEYLETIDEKNINAFKLELKKEAGDILWQLSGLCHVMGWTLEDVAKQNLSKLAARKKAGTIDGNGDGINGEERTR